MIFLKYVAFCTIAYLIYWYAVSFLIGLPGLGIGMLLIYISSKGRGVFTKTFSAILSFLSYLLNFTLLAFIWGVIIGFLTLTTIINSSHPMFYIFLGSIFALFLTAPSGESNLLAAIQSFLVYLFYVLGNYVKMIDTKIAPGHYSPLLNYIWMLSLVIFFITVITGAVLYIRSISELIEEENYTQLKILHERGESSNFNFFKKKEEKRQIPNLNEFLLNAVRNGNLIEVRAALENGADVNARDDNSHTALIWASIKGYTDIARLLIENGAEVDARNSVGATALMYASAYGHADMVKLLTEKNADIDMRDDNGWTVLIVASSHGQSDMVELLIESGANVDIKNDNGWTALIMASAKGYLDVVNVLIENGANVDIKDNKNRTALMHASAYGHADIVKLLIENKADVNVKDNNGLTALMLASYNNEAKIVRLLIENGADVNAKDENGVTALILAFAKKHNKIASLLKSAGAKE